MDTEVADDSLQTQLVFVEPKESFVKFFGLVIVAVIVVRTHYL